MDIARTGPSKMASVKTWAYGTQIENFVWPTTFVDYTTVGISRWMERCRSANQEQGSLQAKMTPGEQKWQIGLGRGENAGETRL